MWNREAPWIGEADAGENNEEEEEEENDEDRHDEEEEDPHDKEEEQEDRHDEEVRRDEEVSVSVRPSESWESCRVDQQNLGELRKESWRKELGGKWVGAFEVPFWSSFLSSFSISFLKFLFKVPL